MEFVKIIQIIITILIAVFSGAWVFIAWSVKQLSNIYARKAELSSQEAKYWKERLKTDVQLSEYWQRSLNLMQHNLAELKEEKFQFQQERDKHAKALRDVKETLEKCQQATGPLLKLLMSSKPEVSLSESDSRFPAAGEENSS